MFMKINKFGVVLIVLSFIMIIMGGFIIMRDINFDNNKVALTADEESETLKVTAHLYDSSHKEVDFANITNKAIKCYWEWKEYCVEPGQDIKLEQRMGKNSSGILVDVNTDIPVNSCYLSHNVLKLKYQIFTR